MEILEISRKFQGNFEEISEIQSNIIINLYMWNLSVGLKYVEILEISLKFLEFSHLRIPSAWVDMYVIVTLIDYCLKFLEFSHLRIPSARVDVYAIIVLIDYFLKFC